MDNLGAVDRKTEGKQRSGMREFLIVTHRTVRSANIAMLHIAMYLLALLTVLVAVDVVMRYVFNSPLTGVKQVAEYALVWLCFLSVGWVLIERKHVAITYVQDLVSGGSKANERRYSIIIDAICLFYTVPLLYLSSRMVWIEFYERTVISGEAGGFPTYIAQFCIPVGFLSLTVMLVLRILANMAGLVEKKGVFVQFEKEQ